MRPRKLAMTTRPSTQLLSSQRRASLRDELYFPGFRGPLSFRGSLRERYPHADFAARHGKCCLPEWSSRIESSQNANPPPSRVFQTMSARDRVPRPFPLGLPTKVDLHVRQITLPQASPSQTSQAKPRRCNSPLHTRFRFLSPILTLRRFSTALQSTFPN